MENEEKENVVVETTENATEKVENQEEILDLGVDYPEDEIIEKEGE